MSRARVVRFRRLRALDALRMAGVPEADLGARLAQAAPSVARRVMPKGQGESKVGADPGAQTVPSRNSHSRSWEGKR